MIVIENNTFRNLGTVCKLSDIDDMSCKCSFTPYVENHNFVVYKADIGIYGIIAPNRCMIIDKFKYDKTKLDTFISEFEDYINIEVADGRNDCDHTFSHLKIFCNRKEFDFIGLNSYLISSGINCDCEIIKKY